MALMKIYSEGESLVVDVTDPYEQSLVGQYHNAIKALIRPPFDPIPLDTFQGLTIAGEQLETDPWVIREIERRGDLVYEDIYDE